MKINEFDPTKDIPLLVGKTILVTGGTAGLGTQTITHLAAHQPAHVYFTGRKQGPADANIAKWQSSFPNVNFVFIRCDLTSFKSVDDAADTLISQCSKLDILIANAGIMAVPADITENGYEIQFGTNHMGHARLIEQLLPVLRAAPSPRLVSLTSQGYAFAPKNGINFTDVKPPSGNVESTSGLSGSIQKWTRYAQGKLANILYAEQLSERYPEISSIAVHPGVIAENGLVTSLGWMEKTLVKMTTFWFQISVEDGAKNTCWAATCEKGKLEGWAYAEPVGETKEPPGWNRGKREMQGKELWEWTQKELDAWDERKKRGELK